MKLCENLHIYQKKIAVLKDKVIKFYKNLYSYPKRLAGILILVILAFTVVNIIQACQLGVYNENVSLTRSEAAGNIIYSGTVCGFDASFTVSSDKILTMQFYQDTYGSYAINWNQQLQTLSGKKPSGYLEPYLTPLIMDLIKGPELSRKGMSPGWFYLTIIAVAVVISILFERQLFRLRHIFTVENWESIEPTDFIVFTGHIVQAIEVVLIFLFYCADLGWI